MNDVYYFCCFTLTGDMSRMCCSFCSLLPTFCVQTKETNWDYYEQNAKGGTLVVGHYAISTLSREVGA